MLKSYVVNKLTFQRTISMGAPLFQHRCRAKTFVLCKYTRSIDNVALIYPQIRMFLQEMVDVVVIKRPFALPLLHLFFRPHL